jgi:hypothetical protein
MFANAIDRTLVGNTVDSHINAYYPFGKRIDNLSFNAGTNQLKYNGKLGQSTNPDTYF